MRGVQPLRQQGLIAAVCLERKVEQVADEWHQTHDAIDGQVQHHACLDSDWCSELAGYPQAVSTDQRADDVAQTRYQADQGVDSEAPLRARNAECTVEQV